jgi:hypothetical protein
MIKHAPLQVKSIVNIHSHVCAFVHMMTTLSQLLDKLVTLM